MKYLPFLTSKSDEAVKRERSFWDETDVLVHQQPCLSELWFTDISDPTHSLIATNILEKGDLLFPINKPFTAVVVSNLRSFSLIQNQILSCLKNDMHSCEL